MTKKHYIKLVEVLRKHFWEIDWLKFQNLVNDMADMCEKDNPNFNREMFITAIYK